MGVRLPGLGALGAYWRPVMAEVLPEVVEPGSRPRSAVVGVRGGVEAEGEVATRTATVRVLHAQLVDGVEKRSVVSHFNKATKGRIVRSLLSAGAEPKGPAELADALRDLGYTVEAQPPARAGTPWSLDVVVTEIH